MLLDIDESKPQGIKNGPRDDHLVYQVEQDHSYPVSSKECIRPQTLPGRLPNVGNCLTRNLQIRVTTVHIRRKRLEGITPDCT